VPDGEFDFLGYTFGRRYSPKTGRPYIATRPSRKSIKRMTEAVRIQIGRNMEWLDAGEMVKCLNQKLGGWANYFNLGPVTPAYRFIDMYTTTRLRRWFCKKHKQPGRASSTTLMSISTKSWDSSDCQCFRKTFRGEGMMFCPRAGCVSSACPVR
jgi:hypothetical protein